MRKAALFVAMALAACAPAADTAAPDRAADETHLREVKQETWPGFYRGQDVAGLGAFLAEDFVNIAPDGSVTERQEELDWVAANEWNPDNFRYEVKRFQWLDDDSVLVIGEGSSDRTDDDGRPCRHVYASSNLLTREAEAPLGWRARYSHVSGDRCDPAGAPRAP